MNNEKMWNKIIEDDYFSAGAVKFYNLQKNEINEDFLSDLKEALKVALDRYIIQEFQNTVENEKEIQLNKERLKNIFENQLFNIGFISRRTNRKRNSAYQDTSISYLFQLIKLNIKDLSGDDFEITNEGLINISSTITLDVKLRSKNIININSEISLYKPFQEIIKQDIEYDYRELDSIQIEFYDTASSKFSGKWSNPDILIKCQDIYFSYELKRWLDIDPIAPHEARNHSRIISNYPYVAIEAPKKFHQFLLEYNDNFQIIKEDCRERGIGLIIFDAKTQILRKILLANFFTPDPIRKAIYIQKILNRP